MRMLQEDPAREAVLAALAAVGAHRTDYPGPAPDAADPVLGPWAAEVAGLGEGPAGAGLPWHALAMLAAIACDKIDELGGDSAAMLRGVYACATAPGEG
jgi:hypothetical protein